MKRVKKQYPDNLRGKVGFFTISWIHGFATMVFTLFMQFLTDYSGIDAALGQAGFAAAFGTAILLITRVIDAIDDPLQAWIMDRSKETKFGKYRGYTLLSVLLCGLGIVIMFTLPGFVKSNAVVLTVWILLGYILYEMGFAFNGTSPILQKVTTDANVRTKITAMLRMGVVLAVIPSVFFIPIATALNGIIGDMGASFSVTCVVITIASCALSLLGVALVKEPYRGNVSTQKNDEPNCPLRTFGRCSRSINRCGYTISPICSEIWHLEYPQQFSSTF